MQKILLTGGAGFIGSNLAHAFLEAGFGVAVLDDLSTGKPENLEPLMKAKGFQFVKGSILDKTLVQGMIEENGIELISHQAAIPSVSKSIKDPAKSSEANVVGTAAIFDIAARCGIKKIVFASSSSIYGDTPELPKKESMPFNPKSPYAVSKAAKEMLGGVFSSLYGLQIIGFRYFNVYGRKQDPFSDYAAVIPKFINKALANEPIPIEGDGLQTRDFTYIDDVVAANLNALRVERPGFSVFNIAFGQRTSVLELAKLIIEQTGSKSEIVHLEKRPGDVRDSLAAIEEARKGIDYRPQTDIRTGLEKTISWYKTKRA